MHDDNLENYWPLSKKEGSQVIRASLTTRGFWVIPRTTLQTYASIPPSSKNQVSGGSEFGACVFLDANSSGVTMGS